MFQCFSLVCVLWFVYSSVLQFCSVACVPDLKGLLHRDGIDATTHFNIKMAPTEETPMCKLKSAEKWDYGSKSVPSHTPLVQTFQT